MTMMECHHGVTESCSFKPLRAGRVPGAEHNGEIAMMVETVLSRSVRLIFAGSMAMVMSAASAQEAEAPAARVEVTGSRIPTANLEGPSPITVVTAKDIQAEGARSVESFLNNLPQVFANQGGSISNGASGTATAARSYWSTAGACPPAAHPTPQPT
jgi:hypothetical protein